MKKHPRDVLNMSDEDVIQLVIEEFKRSDAHISARISDFHRYYAMYRSRIPEEAIRPHGANLFVPYVYSQVETFVPKLYNAMFSNKPYGTLIPVGDGSAEKMEKARLFQELLTYQLDQRIRIVEKGNHIIKDVAIFGTCFSKQVWVKRTKRRKVRERIKLLGLEIPKTARDVTRDVVVMDDPEMLPVSVFNFRFDPTADSIRKAAWCGEYADMDVLEIQEKVKDGFYKGSEELTEYLKDRINGSYGFAAEKQVQGATSRKSRVIPVKEYYTDEAWVHVVDDKFVVLKKANPFNHGDKPYARYAAVTVNGEMYGIGIPEVLESLQAELNTTRNQRIDNISMAINRMWKARRNAGIEAGQLVARPNGIVWLDEMDDVQELTMGDVTSDSRYHEELIKNDMDEATGILDTVRGTTTDRRETATTASLMSQAGGDRLKASTILLDVGGFGDAFNQIVELDQQFITADTYINVFQQDTNIKTLTITPDDLIGKYEVAVASAGTDPAANKEVMRNQLTTLYQTFSQVPFINQEALVKRIFEAYDVKNIDELVMSAPQAPADTLSMGTPTAAYPMGPQSGQMPEPTPENIQMIMQAIENGEQIPPEFVPLAEALLTQMRAEEGLQ